MLFELTIFYIHTTTTTTTTLVGEKKRVTATYVGVVVGKRRQAIDRCRR
jgi:hypothetical protein